MKKGIPIAYRVAIHCAAISLLSILIILIFCGCATSYRTIAATEAAVSAANSAYLDSVVTGQTKTNDVPKVEAAFNATQMALHAAAAAASAGASAPVPATLNQQAVDFTNLVNSVKGVK